MDPKKPLDVSDLTRDCLDSIPANGPYPLLTRNALAYSWAKVREMFGSGGGAFLGAQTYGRDNPLKLKRICEFNDELLLSNRLAADGAAIPKYDHLLDCVVVVRTPGGSLGSGFFVSDAGLIITNHHVVGADKTVEVATSDSRKLTGKVLQIDSKRDLALIQVQGRDFPHLSRATAPDAVAGTEVFSIGSPLGYEGSISKGIVSAIRKVRGVLYVQSDVAINEGNSGGPLISVKSGKVIGVNTWMATKKGAFGEKVQAPGVNFAIAVKEILAAFPNLKAD